MNATNKRSDIGLTEMKKLASTEICVAYGRSGIGGREENQDAFDGMAVGNNVIVTVCDGMGGMNGGQTASFIGKTEIIQSFLDSRAEEWDEKLPARAIDAANAAIYRRALNDPPLRGMGTTATVLALTPEAAYVAHVGDSRIYQLRKGKKKFRTFDHSKVFEMVAKNMMTEEQARQSSFSNIITRALGIRTAVEPVIEKIPYKKGDRFILCSDGIWNCLPEPEMLKLFSLEEATDKEISLLTERVNGTGVERGSQHDNLTAIVLDTYSDSKYQYGLGKRIADSMKKMGKGIRKRLHKK